REDAVLADMSPRRYFCLQCHVPQANAKPLVENKFKSVDALK
ncbi:nitrate reductase cytochrome c-type subunit, partial [Vibrio rotiferianus]